MEKKFKKKEKTPISLELQMLLSSKRYKFIKIGYCKCFLKTLYIVITPTMKWHNLGPTNFIIKSEAKIVSHPHSRSIYFSKEYFKFHFIFHLTYLHSFCVFLLSILMILATHKT
jgi:hypothetical protein